MKSRIGRLCFVVALAAMLGAAFGPRHTEVARAASVPSGLPSHFGIGLAASPDSTGIYGWMPNSGIPFDYAYQYLSGGVNTGSGWETWNTSGQFPLSYAQGAASHNYIPVFPYYELLQSTGTCGSCGEAQKDLSNLNNASLMGSYFSNFRLLMQRLGSGTYGGITGFGKTAIVHVEPDLSGYAEQAVLNNSGSCYGYCTAQGNNPSYLKAAVAGSGDVDAQGYPNTYQGFNWALLHIRDLYAPNVKLAFHISGWATGTDVDTSTSSGLNVTSLGQEAGSFAAQSGIAGVPSGTSTYDLLFNDVSDRDAGYYKYVYGDASHWWDRQNAAFPNFHRWESYVSAASSAAGRSVIVWQVPIGNQYFDTENNTNGHYQDNRAEYFFAHISELVNSGIIGVLFGAGNGGSTVQYDGVGDGVTNPASFCSADGTSSGSICNNHTSTVSDDDGSYIRMESQAYYANPYSLTGSSNPTSTSVTTPSATSTGAVPTATTATTSVAIISASASPSTVAPGGAVALSTTVTSTTALSNVIVDFEVYSGTTKVYQTYQSGVNLTANTAQTVAASWPVPSSQAAGAYTLKIGVFDSTWATLYAWDDNGASITVSTMATSTPVLTATTAPASTATATPTAQSTPTPVSTTQPTRTATILGASASPNPIAPKQKETFTSTVTFNVATTGVTVAYNLINASGNSVYSSTWTGQSFVAGTPRTFTSTWRVPQLAAGAYTLQIRVTDGGSTVYGSNLQAATLQIT